MTQAMKEKNMNEAEIMRRLSIIECRLPPLWCDKVGHETRMVTDKESNSWYACKHCGRDELDIEREPVVKVPPEGVKIDKQFTVTIAGESAFVLRNVCLTAIGWLRECEQNARPGPPFSRGAIEKIKVLAQTLVTAI